MGAWPLAAGWPRHIPTSRVNVGSLLAGTAHAVAAAPLRLVERTVRPGDQTCRAGVLLSFGDADAHGYLLPPGIDENAMRGDARSDSLGDHQSLMDVSARQYDGEFLSAEPGQQIAPAKMVPHRDNNLAQASIACQMTVAIVESLEEIDISEQQEVAASRFGTQKVQNAIELPAVSRARYHIGCGNSFEQAVLGGKLFNLQGLQQSMQIHLARCLL